MDLKTLIPQLNINYVPTKIDREGIFIIFTTHSTRAGYDTRSIFKWSLTGLISGVSFC